MKFQLGDKVKFLNQIGGGVVTKVTDDFVFVQDDTGFDIPMDPKELIRMADMSGAGKMFNDSLDRLSDATKKLATDLPGVAPKMTIPQTPEDEIKALKSQIANLKDQVAKLKHQLSSLQKQNAQSLADNILAQYMVAPGEAEVDLHIESLVERPGDLRLTRLSRYRCIISAPV